MDRPPACPWKRGQRVCWRASWSAQAVYRTATVTPPWLATPPASTPRAPSRTTRRGTTTFTCITPAICPGAPPAKRTSAATPPIVTVTGATGCRQRRAPIFPSTPAGEVCPSPVAKSESTEPAAAGAAGAVRACRPDSPPPPVRGPNRPP